MASMASSALLQKWEWVTGVKFKDILTSTHQEIAQIALMNKKLLMAAAALMDQAPQGSPGQEFAAHVMQCVKQSIRENVPAAMAELNKFSRKGEFSERQLRWIEWLAGATVSGFSYPNGQAFRGDGDANLETKHDYVQLVFPSLAPSQHANSDLCVRDKVDLWKDLLHGCPTIALNIILNIQLNAIRMLYFWGFKFAFGQDAPNVWGTDRVVLKDNLNSLLHKNENHNVSRATRFIIALRMFGLSESIGRTFVELLFARYGDSTSLQYWKNAWENRDIPIFVAEGKL
jgi:hypothetical protein